ncbi:Gfo/Idh/MocA family oxidoreductase [Paenibacillus athensensis]|nr:Gfo/Idh/MocA family oxidoreductase [Paenibacillus athensensis]MCD1260839.1 Gfo/Idh/MocA family oxidoreductase [Paenibacillus athensensis]
MLHSLIIGLGQIGLLYDLDPLRHKPSSHTTAYLDSERFRLVAAADIHQGRESLLRGFDDSVRFYTQVTAMLQDHAAEVISICTPPDNHLALIREIISTTSTKLIFCEKPVVANLDEARSLHELMQTTGCMLIPNLSRRWNKGMQRIYEALRQGAYGELQRIHLRYTRGIYNTGSHIFDLVSWFAGRLQSVLVIDQVPTSADHEGDSSFTLHFTTERQVSGYAEAFDDRYYYMFEMDLYLTRGKITILESGNKVRYERVGEHQLFSGFQSLHLDKFDDNLLHDSTLKHAMEHIADVVDGKQQPVCTLKDGLHPIFIAEAVQRSYLSRQWEPVKPL